MMCQFQHKWTIDLSFMSLIMNKDDFFSTFYRTFLRKKKVFSIERIFVNHAVSSLIDYEIVMKMSNLKLFHNFFKK